MGLSLGAQEGAAGHQHHEINPCGQVTTCLHSRDELGWKFIVSLRELLTWYTEKEGRGSNIFY